MPPTMDKFDTLTPVTADDGKNTITSAPSKACDFDPLLTDILKEFLSELLPFLTEMCNKSLSQGCLPQSQRHAIVTPRLKKNKCRFKRHNELQAYLKHDLYVKGSGKSSLSSTYCTFGAAWSSTEPAICL